MVSNNSKHVKTMTMKNNKFIVKVVLNRTIHYTSTGQLTTWKEKHNDIKTLTKGAEVKLACPKFMKISSSCKVSRNRVQGEKIILVNGVKKSFQNKNK